MHATNEADVANSTLHGDINDDGTQIDLTVAYDPATGKSLETPVIDKLIRENQYTDDSYDWANDWLEWGYTDGNVSATHREKTERDDRNEGSRNKVDSVFEDPASG